MNYLRRYGRNGLTGQDGGSTGKWGSGQPMRIRPVRVLVKVSQVLVKASPSRCLCTGLTQLWHRPFNGLC